MTERGDRRPGEVVGGKYRIGRFLASGGMGSVYEAQHTLVKRRFAVKFLHPDLATRRDLLTRFQREAEAAGALESENVAASVDLGIAADGSPYIVMEYLVGESLELLLERLERLPLERAADLVAQACRGVQAAHALGIVHRDLKPHNLFVCRREDGTDLLKVLDFGVAKLEVVEKTSAATRTGTLLGTPAYMSPEQARGEKDVDHRADVYALGAILYELLSGQKPHPGESHNAVLHHISTQPAVPLESVQPGLPEPLVSLVAATLAGEPEARPASAEALAQALAPWARRDSWPAPKLEVSAPRHPEPSATLPAPDGPPVERLSPAPSLAVASLDQRGHATSPVGRTLRPLALGGGVLLLSVIVYVLLGRQRPAAEPPSLPASELRDTRVSTDEPPQPISPAPAEAPPVAIPAVANGVPPGAAVAAAPPPPDTDRPSGRPARRPVGSDTTAHRPAAKLEAHGHSAPVPVTFDQKNPYQ